MLTQGKKIWGIHMNGEWCTDNNDEIYMFDDFDVAMTQCGAMNKYRTAVFYEIGVISEGEAPGNRRDIPVETKIDYNAQSRTAG